MKVADDQHENLKIHFEACHNFIKEALSTGSGILVHCSAGISRSPTIVISFVMIEKRMTFKQAYQFVKEKRSVVCPNVGFQGQLKKYEDELRNTKCTLQ